MKIVMYLAAVVGGQVFTTGLLAWVLATSSARSPGAVLLAALAPTAFVGAAWCLGTRSVDAPVRTPGTAWTAAFGTGWQRSGSALLAIGILATLAHALTNGNSVWPALVLVASGFVLSGFGIGTGRWIRARRPDELISGPRRMPAAERLQRQMACLVAIGSQAIFWISLLAGAPSRPTGDTGQLVYHLLGNTQLALYATGLAAMICGAYLRDQVLHDARVNRDQTALLRRIIRGRTPLPQDAELRRQALRFALSMPYQSFFRAMVFPLLFLAQALQYYVGVIRGEGSFFGQVTSFALAVGLVLSTAHFLRWGRAARRFARRQPQGPPVTTPGG
ncbi:MAG: hypothetical protein ACTHWW_06645 [Arthrobacter sp.]|uniref:hypothetical protein n=1 Tax=unclassified Arthrobacter TaxID=235627 RepID=UPI002655E31C|nr:hypothetical protein [Micrococcaceae bacterium]MDN5886314.1 hypothetical protein [Micrococcaceae bacterium]MDN5904982.1 hypothetical protein [Micrococcaceae bacterium]